MTPSTKIDPAVWAKSEKVLKAEILRDGSFFIIRTTYASGKVEEYKNTSFEDLITVWSKNVADEVDP